MEKLEILTKFLSHGLTEDIIYNSHTDHASADIGAIGSLASFFYCAYGTATILQCIVSSVLEIPKLPMMIII